MTAEQVSFFVLAAVAVASALGVILFRNAVYSMLSLILNLLSLAFFFLMLECACSSPRSRCSSTPAR